MADETKLLDKIMAEAAKFGHDDIRIRDIAYAILQINLQDPLVAFMVAFNGEDCSDSIVEEYQNSKKQTFLQRFIQKTIAPSANEANDTPQITLNNIQQNNDISFEQNKAELLRLLEDIERGKKAGSISEKDAIKLETEIRVKLNDKFNVTEAEQEQCIIVQPKCNHICEITRRECWLQTKEYAMEKWNLIENPNPKQ